MMHFFIIFEFLLNYLLKHAEKISKKYAKTYANGNAVGLARPAEMTKWQDLTRRHCRRHGVL
jgi:hypothetical protein